MTDEHSDPMKEWLQTLNADDRWSHCGNRRQHNSHKHTIVMNEGAYPGVTCIGTPNFVPPVQSCTDVDKIVDEVLKYHQNAYKTEAENASSITQRSVALVIADAFQRARKTLCKVIEEVESNG